MSPVRLQLSEERKQAKVERAGAGAPPLTQKVRIGGVIREIDVSQPKSGVAGSEDDLDLTQGMTGEDFSAVPHTGVGKHLDQAGHPVAGGIVADHGVGDTASFDLDSFRRTQSESGRLADIIATAVDEVIERVESGEFGDDLIGSYAEGWEDDEELVQVTADLVLDYFDFNRDDIIRVLHGEALGSS